MATMQRPYFIFIDRSFAKPRHKKFPDAGWTAVAHDVRSPVPAIEISHNADSHGVRSPNPELHSRNAVDHHWMRAHLFVFLVMSSFADQIQIEIGKQRGK